MTFLGLPATTNVNKVIPKNAFDKYTNSKQKKLFSELIARIIWTNKISTDTVNLETKVIQEIQVFRVELKVNGDIQNLLDIIDKSIPYTIIFIIQFEDSQYISTSVKHPHPINADNAVIDWTFKTEWYSSSENRYDFQLKRSIDAVYQNFCIQISGRSFGATKSLEELIDHEKKVGALLKEIARLKTEIAGSKQFNSKVELNLKLKNVEKEYNRIQGNLMN